MANYAYRRYLIYHNSRPLAFSDEDSWNFIHEDYDGAGDADDPRCGQASDIATCKQLIDELEAA